MIHNLYLTLQYHEGVLCWLPLKGSTWFLDTEKKFYFPI